MGFRAALGALVLVCLLPAASQAVVVLPKNSAQPIMGHLVRHDESGVVVRQELPGGKSRELRFTNREIDELIITVAPERLSRLDPGQPEQYREYAEELAEKHRDPEARNMAVRLYAIAAARGSGNVRRGALLGLIALARTPDEERKFRAAAYLYDPDHDADVLVNATAARPAGSNSAARDELATALRLVRQGKPDAAKALLDRPAVQAELEPIAAILTRPQLAEMCAVRQVNGTQLIQLLRAELALDDAGAARGSTDSRAVTQPAKSAANWSPAGAGGGLAPLPSVSLDRLTEFDPAECVFRAGKWVNP